MDALDETFDFIVAGAGSAGCAVAARLSENPGSHVLLLEAGPRDTNPWIHLPIGYYRTIVNPKIGWGLETEPDPGIGGRRMSWPRGKVLGGSSSVNGLAWVRGQAADYDHWRQLGNTGWAYDDVLPFFRKIEAYDGGDPDYRGREGPLGITDASYRLPLLDAFIEAAQACGIPRNPDYNGAVQDGVGYFQLSMQGGWRRSAATAYLRPARNRANLVVRTGCLIDRVLVENGRAAGIVYRQDGREISVRARGEVILSAGAIGSPAILMRSGLGPGDALRACGIEPVRDLPGVGSNLQDHLQIRLVYRTSTGITMNDVSNSLWRRVMAGLEWGLARKGPLTVGAGTVYLFWKTREEVATPDVQFHVIPFSAEKPGQALHPFSGYTISVCQLRPESRGSITLKTADPADAPAIRPNYLASESDRQTMLDGVKLARRIMAQEPMDPYREAEVIPGPEMQDDAAIAGYIRDKSTTIFHPSSTCMMGPCSEAGAVVDPRLRVHGLDGLRVADASVMPTVVSGNTNAPTIMIGEKAAAMIAEDRGLSG